MKNIIEFGQEEFLSYPAEIVHRGLEAIIASDCPMDILAHVMSPAALQAYTVCSERFREYLG